MKKEKYTKLLWFGLTLWFLETAYFGWNMNAQSGTERVLDIISGAMIISGAIGLIAIDATANP